MKRYKLTIAYDGTNYAGWQLQKNGVSIQQKLREALTRLDHPDLCPTGSGRTDAGVHAQGQVAHVDLSWEHGEQALKSALNNFLPEDIRVSAAQEVADDFHAQKDASKKWYRYVIACSQEPLLFQRHYLWQLPQTLDVGAIQAAAAFLVGEHDFASFQAARSSVKATVRCLEQIELSTGPAGWREESFDPRVHASGQMIPKRQDPALQYVVFDFIGNGFLKKMVRNIVGTLVEVGRGRLEPNKLQTILQAKDREAAGPCAPARGLCLMEVYYVVEGSSSSSESAGSDPL